MLKEACWQQPTDGDGMFLETLGLVAATVQLFVNNIATQLKVWALRGDDCGLWMDAACCDTVKSGCT